MINILIADDHTILRAGLKQILAKEPDMVVSGEAGTGNEVLRLVGKHEYDLIVLDLSMPGRSGLEVLKELKHHRPKLPVLVLSMHPEEDFAVRVIKAGAAGYLTKQGAPRQLIVAIRKVIGGGKYISPTVAETLAYSLDADTEKPPHKSLSDREYQVMCMIASGKRLSQIAKELALSEKTISTYRAHILRKMKMQNNAELIRYAILNRLVD